MMYFGLFGVVWAIGYVLTILGVLLGMAVVVIPSWRMSKKQSLAARVKKK